MSEIAELDDLLASIEADGSGSHEHEQQHESTPTSELDDLLTSMEGRNDDDGSKRETWSASIKISNPDGSGVEVTKEYSVESDDRSSQRRNTTGAQDELDELVTNLSRASVQSEKKNQPRLPPEEVQSAVVFKVAEPQRASIVASATELDSLLSSFAAAEAPPRHSVKPNPRDSTPPAPAPRAPAPAAQKPKNYSDDDYERFKRNAGSNTFSGDKGKNCNRCNQAITGEILTAAGRAFHPEHFTCAFCNTNLGTAPFYDINGRFSCGSCYKKDLPSCGSCRRPIEGACLSAMGQKWHPEHFTCAKCGNQFPGGRYHEKNGRPYCDRDYNDTFGEKCATCGGSIQGESVSALGKRYHPQHFVCNFCQVSIGAGNFYDIGGKPYCQQHSTGGSPSTCGHCNRPIVGKSISAAGKMWHPEHFVCSSCSTPLQGAYSEANNKPYCKPCAGRLFS